MIYTDNIPGCTHFTWKDALYLPSWQTCHIPSDTEQQNLIQIFNKLEQIREFLGNYPINVHCAIRPVLDNPQSNHNGMDYNKAVGGAINSSHKIGCAIDFDVSSLSCDSVRDLLIPKLEEFNIRMENNGLGAPWIHIDSSIPHPNRYFIP